MGYMKPRCERTSIALWLFGILAYIILQALFTAKISKVTVGDLLLMITLSWVLVVVVEVVAAA